jgi:flagellar basal body rod protein FlgC
MSNAINIGLAGMRAAEARVNVRAQNIVNWQSEDYRPLEAEQTTDASGAPRVRVSRPPELSGEFPMVDIAEELVDMRLAQRAYEASAKIVRAEGEMQKTLLDTFA